MQSNVNVDEDRLSQDLSDQDDVADLPAHEANLKQVGLDRKTTLKRASMENQNKMPEETTNNLSEQDKELSRQ